MDIVEPPFSSEDRDRLDALGNPAGSVTTLGDLIARRMATGAEAIAYHFLDASDSVEISWAALFDRASALAGRLARVAVPGDRIVVTAGAGIDYIVALFACFGGGFVAVPCAPFRSARHVDTLRAIVADCSPAAILTDQDRGLQESLPATPVLTIAGAPDGAPPPGWPYRARPTDIAVLQYTSGSTGRPKGVMVTHANLLDNLGRQSERYGISAAIRAVIWLPPFHDMGLSAGVLQPLAFGFPILLMSPQYAMQHPLRWLQAIDDFDATISGGPPFAYAACTARLAATPSIDLDLSRLEVAFLGAEPIRPGVLRAFADAFAPHGFRPDAFLASYGLAEATLIVTGRRGGIATHRVRGREETLCGPPVEAHRIVIVDPATGRARAEGEEGEVWVAGPGVAAGYWRAPDESEATFGARLAGGDTRFLRTGDLGCLIGGELVVSGRLKDIIIVAGRNLAAGDVEETMRDAGGERLRHAVVTAIAYEDAGLERLAAVIEQSRTRPLDADAVAQLRSALGTAVATRFGVRLDDIAVVRFGTLPRTSSGKVRRHLCGPVFESNRSNRREPDHAE